jgi:hypothetical protein
MRNLGDLDAYRLRSADVLRHYGSFGDETCGMFDLPYPRTSVTLRCIASSDDGWDHVSVSLKNRTPNWAEMEFVKRAFFAPDETAMQLHVPAADHINCHPNCLHLWRPNDGREIPRPPAEFVAPKTAA